MQIREKAMRSADLGHPGQGQIRQKFEKCPEALKNVGNFCSLKVAREYT